MSVPRSTARSTPGSRALALLATTALTLTGTAVALVADAPPAAAVEQTYTHIDGATITYDTEVVIGEPIVVSGTGWVTKPDYTGPYEISEGDEGSIIGVKFMPGSGGTVVRDPKPTNPFTGDNNYSSPDVWEIIQAAGTGEWWWEYYGPGTEYGDWQVEIPWPSAENGAVNPPDLQVGDTFSLQFLGGTLYGGNGNLVGVDPNTRPDYSRTINLEFTIVEADDPGVAPSIADTPLPADGTVGVAYDAFTVPASGDPAPEDFSVVAGALPPGLSLDAATGELTGTPTDAGEFTFTVQAANGVEPAATRAYTVTVDAAAEPLEITEQPAMVETGSGSEASFTASVSGGVEPVTVQWQRSTGANANNPPPNYVALNATNTLDGSFAEETVRFIAGQNTNSNNRWYRAVFTDAAGNTVTTDAARLRLLPAPTVTQHPNTIGQTIDEGETATFTAAATSELAYTVQWESNTTVLPNGEPDTAGWTPVDGATAETLTVEGTDSAAQHGTFYRATFTSAAGTTASYAAELRFFDQLDTEADVTVSGESYGPGAANTGIPFSVTAPNAIVHGEPIIITGTGYLATDDATGSVANFMVDASYSGDPNTLNSTREIINPVTGAPFPDVRSHGIVQADGEGSWTIEIPWPDETNTDRPVEFFESNWTEGTQHIVRILTGSLLSNPADRQRGISVRFTVVDESTAPVGEAPEIVTQPEHALVETGEDAVFTASATGDPEPTVQWEAFERSGSDWVPVEGATSTTLELADVTQSQSGTLYRAVFTNSVGSAATSPAVLTVTEVQDPDRNYTLVMAYGQPAGVLITPTEVEVGEPITVSGNGWFLGSGSGGSGGPIFINQPTGGTGPVTVVDRVIENQIPGSTYADARAHGVFHSDEDGNWSLTFPFPTPENSNLTEETAWEAGQEQTFRILTGSLVAGDQIRTVAAAFDVVAGEEPPVEGTIALSATEVEQYGDVWFDLADFEPGTDVSVELVDADGEVLASSPFTIGDDGNTADPDGQTYRKVTVPRDAEPGSGYALRVTGADGAVLATSEDLTVLEATTRVYNPGDHSGGVEDLEVQQGGTWTFHAVGFAPDGELTATAVIDGETVTLGGIGQTDDAWPLDENGDTARESFTRVQIPIRVPVGPLDVTFTDGETTVVRTLGITTPSEAVVTVAESGELGGTLRVTGAGFVHPDGDQGSRVGIKIAEGAYSRVDGTLHQNRTIWWIVDADENGSFEIDMPLPNGTTADDGDTLGSDPAMPEGTYTLRFLTGSLLPGDQSRTLLSEEFEVTAPEPVAVAPEVSGQPVDVTADEGEDAVFTAAASGDPEPTVQWESSTDGEQWVAVGGATSTTLTVPAVTVEQSGTRYRAVFTNSAGSATTSAATLTVTEVPTEPEPEPVPPTPGRGFYLNDGWGPHANHEFSFGRPGDEVFVGDWDGDGADTLAVRRGNTFYLTNSLYGGNADVELTFGRASDEVLVGDWDGDEVDTLGVRRGNAYFLTNSFAGGWADEELTFGRASDEVFVGDWDADEVDTLGVRRGNAFFLSNSFAGGWAEEEFTYGRASDVVLVGDWDGDGIDTFAVRRGNRYLIANTLTPRWADIDVTYGRASDEVFVGDWDGDGEDTLGIRR